MFWAKFQVTFSRVDFQGDLSLVMFLVYEVYSAYAPRLFDYLNLALYDLDHIQSFYLNANLKMKIRNGAEGTIK
jgi:hypothetical protein